MCHPSRHWECPTHARSGLHAVHGASLATFHNNPMVGTLLPVSICPSMARLTPECLAKPLQGMPATRPQTPQIASYDGWQIGRHFGFRGPRQLIWTPKRD
jgi:hypothetical protein